MKLFAPRNDWTMSSPASNNWWNMAGTYGSASGIRIDESTALTFSAVFAATRILSETMATLPCEIKKQVDYRTEARATDHALWSLLLDQPTPEQDSMAWFDSQVAFQVNWGNAYAEIQRDTEGRIVAMWPIHPSRIPLKNIKRNGNNPIDFDGIVAKAGELVYLVNNDDGSKTPIPASDMLHVPGVLSTNGVTGQSIVKWAANSIGNAIATETHAGAVFKNGAVTNMVIKSKKTVGPDTATRLRQQWQQVFGGVQNHYKTLLLEDGMEPVPINMDPESTQLLASRQFAVTEIARWYRLPPHLLADLSRSTFSNIESENISFIVYSLMPWIIRWEKALKRQLLTEEEKRDYKFEFNVRKLLRGDSAARAQYYQIRYNLGSMSPNDIREDEGENPIPGGDQYFVMSNNVFPLDKVAEMADATIKKAKPQPKSEPQAAPQPAVPEDIVDRINTAIAARADSALNAARDGVKLAIQAEINALMQYEARAARDASKKPRAFFAWQEDFYPKFASKLSTAITLFVPAAARMGIDIDAVAITERYQGASRATWDVLADLPLDQFEGGVDRAINSWSERPKQMADAIFERMAA